MSHKSHCFTTSNESLPRNKRPKGTRTIHDEKAKTKIDNEGIGISRKRYLRSNPPVAAHRHFTYIQILSSFDKSTLVPFKMDR